MSGMFILKKRTRGLTLIESVMAVAMIAILALGALSYQYYGARHIRISQVDLMAARIGQLLLEDWKSVGGLSNYDPTALGLGFTQESSDTYRLDIDGATLHAQLATEKIDEQQYAGILRRIIVTLRWGNYGIGPDSHSLAFTTYVRQGQD